MPGNSQAKHAQVVIPVVLVGENLINKRKKIRLRYKHRFPIDVPSYHPTGTNGDVEYLRQMLYPLLQRCADPLNLAHAPPPWYYRHAPRFRTGAAPRAPPRPHLAPGTDRPGQPLARVVGVRVAA